jgi:hypothetical protein
VVVLFGILVAFVGSDLPGDQPWSWTSGNVGKPLRTLTVARTQVELRWYNPIGAGSNPQGVRPKRPIYWRVGDFKFDTSPVLVTASMDPSSAQYLYGGFELVVPFWPIVVMALLFLIIRGARLLRRAEPAGLCPFCKYDLRATPDRCPECGRVPPR